MKHHIYSKCTIQDATGTIANKTLIIG